jgi:transcriptional regulator with XRE-family HTH domain
MLITGKEIAAPGAAGHHSSMPRRAAKQGHFRPNRVKLLREAEGLSDQQLADLLRWPVSKVSKVENRQQDLSLSDIYSLAHVLKVHRLEIFEELPYSPRVRAMAELVSQLDESEQDRVFRVVDAMAKPPAGDDQNGGSRRDGSR